MIINTVYKPPNQVINHEINMMDFQNKSSGKSKVQPPTNEISQLSPPQYGGAREVAAWRYIYLKRELRGVSIKHI